MKGFKKFLTVALTLAMVVGLIGLQSPTKVKATEGDPVFTVWVNGKDIKANEAKKIEAAYYKSATTQYKAMYSGGKLNVLVTTGDIDTVSELVALIDEKGKASKEAVSKGAELAKAKIKEGTITVTSSKKAGTFYVWVYETKKDPKTKKTVVVNETGSTGTEVKPVSYKGVAKMADKGLILTEKKITEGYSKTAKSVTKFETLPTKNVVLYIANKGDAAADATCEYVVTTPTGQNEAVKAAVSEKTITITVPETVGSEKGESFKFTVTNKQSQAKANFTVTVKIPVIEGKKEITASTSNVTETYKIMLGKTEVKDDAVKLSLKSGPKDVTLGADGKSLVVKSTAEAGTAKLVVKIGEKEIATLDVTIKAAPKAE